MDDRETSFANAAHKGVNYGRVVVGHLDTPEDWALRLEEALDLGDFERDANHLSGITRIALLEQAEDVASRLCRPYGLPGHERLVRIAPGDDVLRLDGDGFRED